MTQEDRELLLKDLCARLPYKVIFKDECDENLQEIHYIRNKEIYTRTYPHLPYWIENVKPYLRPMSSMTEEEREQLRLLKNALVECDESNDEKFYGIINDIHHLYYSHHIDCCGLIKKGLALEAKEGMYNQN